MPAEVWVGRAKAEETQERGREGRAHDSKDPRRSREIQAEAGKAQSGGDPKMEDPRQLGRPKERKPRAEETQGEKDSE